MHTGLDRQNVMFVNRVNRLKLADVVNDSGYHESVFGNL